MPTVDASSPDVGDHNRNNLDFLRLLFAVAVIFSHSYPLSGHAAVEPLESISHGRVTFGTLALGFFFVISGFLVTRSYLLSRSVGNYLSKRALRILPGYGVAVALCVGVVGPLAAAGTGHQYIGETVARGLRMDSLLSEQLFVRNPLPFWLNGSLWTIRYECGCYLLVILIAGLGLLRRPALMLCLLIAVSVLSLPLRVSQGLTPQQYMVTDAGLWGSFVRAFLIGMNLYLWRRKVGISVWRFGVAAVVAVVSVRVELFELRATLLDLSTAYIVYCLAFADWIPAHHFGRFGDFSYGTYLYGWPVQQLLVWYLPGWSSIGLFLAALPLSVGLAVLSWFGIERPFLRLKRRAAAH